MFHTVNSPCLIQNPKSNGQLGFIIDSQLLCTVLIAIFKPGARRPAAGARLVSYNHFHSAKVYVCVYVCVRTPPRP